MQFGDREDNCGGLRLLAGREPGVHTRGSAHRSLAQVQVVEREAEGRAQATRGQVLPLLQSSDRDDARAKRTPKSVQALSGHTAQRVPCRRRHHQRVRPSRR